MLADGPPATSGASPLLDPVDHAEGLALAFEAVLRTAEDAAYALIDVVVLGVGTLEHLSQAGRDVLQRHPLATGGVAVGRALRRITGRSKCRCWRGIAIGIC